MGIYFPSITPWLKNKKRPNKNSARFIPMSYENLSNLLMIKLDTQLHFFFIICTIPFGGSRNFIKIVNK